MTLGEGTIIDGTGVQRTTNSRWGDYTDITVDPTDDCTFWYMNGYYTLAGQAIVRQQVGKHESAPSSYLAATSGNHTADLECTTDLLKDVWDRPFRAIQNFCRRGASSAAPLLIDGA